ncbi:hypothetical protein HDV63DRAFT_361508 [Trichoderma sp. SZMC 28014]
MQQQLLQLLAFMFAASSFLFDCFLCSPCPAACAALADNYRTSRVPHKYTMIQADTVTPYGKRLRARSTNSFSKVQPRWQEHHVTSPDRLVRIMTSSRRYR